MPTGRQRGVEGIAPWLAVGLALVTLLGAFRYGIFVAAGADSYGYVSQASLWARGQLRQAQPIVRALPRVFTDEVVAPLGYRPARVVGLPGGIVPTYAPGLPMVMAVFARAAGKRAVYLAVPLLAALTVWLTFALARRLSGDGAGVLAAVLVASSPTFLSCAVRPMSDLPATAWWTLALVTAAGTGSWRAALSGAATALAILTRPNLAPLGLAVGLPFLWDVAASRGERRTHLRRLTAFAGAAIIGPIAVAVINDYLYGSPVRSGYGGLGTIFSSANIVTNVTRYTGWLLETETPVMALALAAPAIAWRTSAPTAIGGAWSARRLTWVSVALGLLTFGLYLGYLPFEEWTYLRFLLPAYPVAMALSASVVAGATRWLPAAWRITALILLAAVVASVGVGKATDRSVFGWAQDERRYVDIGQFIADRLPPRAVIFSMQHSGSARHYSGRLTVRYDLVAPDALDQAVRDLADRGFKPYLLLDASEERQFLERFGGHSTWGALDWPPMAATSTSTVVRLFDPADRARALAGEPVETVLLP